LTRHAAFATSVALHVTAVVAGGHALSEGMQDRAGASAPIEVEVITDAPQPRAAAPTPDEETQPPPRPTEVRSASALPSPGAAATPLGTSKTSHHHAYPVRPDHDAHPHDPSLVHAIVGAPPAALPEAVPIATVPSSEAPSVEAPLHFVLESAALATRGATGSSPAGSAVATKGSNLLEASTVDPIVPEANVDVPARLLSSVPVVYPEAARAAEIEADVSLELVVDTDGRVTHARPLAAHDLGLADAALRAVRAYRFTPARRAGRAVRVRMRWTVAFRLQ
jgi:protein TonB